MADYQCYPIWLIEDEETDNIDPSVLPVSKSTLERLNCWAEWYDSTLKQDDPENSGFKSSKEENDFNAEGVHLFRQLLAELPKSYEVFYYSEDQQKLIAAVDVFSSSEE
ncbi:hypothetical protein [Romeriopsis navalis]|nr:hypothetical protein [Romeriopsis navalis]